MDQTFADSPFVINGKKKYGIHGHVILVQVGKINGKRFLIPGPVGRILFIILLIQISKNQMNTGAY